MGNPNRPVKSGYNEYKFFCDVGDCQHCFMIYALSYKGTKRIWQQ